MRSRNARDRQHVAFKEAHQVWSDLGLLPLKGRILEIIGGQALANVFSERRYKNLTEDMTDLVKGRYGPLYSIADEELRRLALEAREAERGKSWEGRLRQPPGITEEEDILTFSLFPDEAARFFTPGTKSRLHLPHLNRQNRLRPLRLPPGWHRLFPGGSV